MKRLILLIVGIGLFVGTLWLGWSFRSGNATPIDLDLIWLRVPNLEIWWVILVSMAIGAVATGILLSFSWLRIRLLNHRYRRAIRKLEAELHELRSLPLSESEDTLRDASSLARTAEGQ